MTDMKARRKRVIALILSAAIFLCNVPVTALAEDIEEPSTKETQVIEKEQIAEDVTEENITENDKNTSKENFSTDDKMSEDNVASSSSDATEQDSSKDKEDLQEERLPNINKVEDSMSNSSDAELPEPNEKLSTKEISSQEKGFTGVSEIESVHRNNIIEEISKEAILQPLMAPKSSIPKGLIPISQLEYGAFIDKGSTINGEEIIWSRDGCYLQTSNVIAFMPLDSKNRTIYKNTDLYRWLNEDFDYCGEPSFYYTNLSPELRNVIEEDAAKGKVQLKYPIMGIMNYLHPISKPLGYSEFDGNYPKSKPTSKYMSIKKRGTPYWIAYSPQNGEVGINNYVNDTNEIINNDNTRQNIKISVTSDTKNIYGVVVKIKVPIYNVYATVEPDDSGFHTLIWNLDDYCEEPVLQLIRDKDFGTVLFATSEGAKEMNVYCNGKLIKTVTGDKILHKANTEGKYYIVAKAITQESKSDTLNISEISKSITPKITPIYNDSTATFAEQQTVSFKVEEEGAKTSSISSVSVVGNKAGDIPITNKHSIYSFSTDENDSFTITAKNTYGNSDTTVINVSKVDKEAPLLSVLPSTTTATSKPITLQITASDSGSGIKEITLPNGGKYAGDRTSFEVSTNGEYTVTATDNTDKEKTVSVNIGNLDFELPTIDVHISTTSTTKDNITATVTASDNIAVDYIELPDGSKINATTASFTIESNGSFTFKVVDKAGNENIKTVTVENVDKDGPTIAAVPSTEEYTNKPVTLAITASDINGVEKITLPDGTEVSGGTAEYIVEKNASLEILATDGLGSVTKQETVVDNIDTEPPQITLTPDTTDYVKDGVKVVITGSDNREVDKIVLEDGTEIKGNKTDIFVKENKTIKATVYDKAGNFKSGSLKITNIDSTPPTLTYSYDDTVTKGNVEVTVTANDDIGVKGIKLPNGVFVTSTKSTFTADKNGSYICTAVDQVDNETPKTIDVNCIDRIAPTIEKISITPIGKMKGLFTGSDVTVSAVANDNVEIDRIEYRVVGIDTNFKPYTTPLLFDMDINTTIEFIAYDTAGNPSEMVASDKIEVDKTAPTISYTVSTEDLTKDDVLITIEAKDNKAVKHIKLPNGELIEADKTVFTATENSDYEFIAYDAVGNASEELVVKIKNIDKGLPTAEFIYDSTPTREIFEVTVKASDNNGIKSITLPDGTVANSNTSKFTVDKNGIYEIIIEDIIGNIAKAPVTINNFDFEKPVITSVKLGEAGLLTKLLTNKSVKLTVEATDDTGITTYEYKLVNSGNEVIQDWTNLGSASGVIADKDFDGSVIVRVTDGVGNISDESTTAFTLDITPPTLTYDVSTNMPTDEPVLVTITATDNIKVKSIKLPNGKIIDGATANYLIRDNGKYKLTVTDTANNSTTETIKISNIKGYGIPEKLPFIDLDNDGKNDMLLNPPFPDGDDFVDLDGDGKDDRKDLNDDGIVDWFDFDGNGTNDIQSPYLDLDDDGKNDLYLPPKYPKGDDVLLGKNGDECRKDLDGDSIVDWIDFDGDGINDYLDTDGDGKPDWIDTNGDGKNDIEKIFIDLDGDGINDITYNSTSSISVVAETDGAEVTIKSDTKTYVLVPTRILDEKDILEPDTEYQTFVLNKDGSITNLDSAELHEDSTIKVLAAYKVDKTDSASGNEDTTVIENNPFGDRVCFKIIKEGTHELIIRDSNENEKIIPVTVKFNKDSKSQVTISSGGGSSHTEVRTKIKEVPVEIPIYIEKPIYVEKEKLVYVDKPVTEKADADSTSKSEEHKVVSQASSSRVDNTSSWYIPIALIIVAGAGGYFIGSKSKKRED